MRKFLHILIFALLLTTLFCIGVSAAEYTDASGRTWLFTTTESDKTATITGAKLKTGEERTSELNIPSEVYIGAVKYTVTKIGPSAFKCGDNSNSGDTFLAKKYFGHVTIPSTVTSIGEGAFEYSAIYGTVVIPDSVTSIGNYAFRGCVGLDTVVYSKSLDYVPQSCFSGCKALVEFRTRGYVKTYKSNAFYGCEALLYFNYAPVAMPTLEEEICESAFKYAETIESSAFYNTSISGLLDLSSLKSLGQNAFYGCVFIEKVILGTCNFRLDAFAYVSSVYTSMLKEVEISASNENYCSVNGIVYSKDMKTLYLYPPAKIGNEFVIPESVTTIGDSAFLKAKLLKIIITKNVTTINNNAFAHSAIQSMFFPSNVTTVGSKVIDNCPNVEWVIFDTGVTNGKNDSVSISSCPRLKSMAFVKSGRFTVGGATYMPNQSCEDYGFSSHFYGYLDENPTCEEGGTYKCCLCDAEVQANALGHKGIILSRTTLSCTTSEAYTVNCQNCGEIKEVIVTQHIGHIEGEVVNAMSDKYSFSYTQCTVCNNILLKSFTTNTFTSGDVNGDGIINSNDIDMLTQLLAGSAVSTNWYSCDIDADGKVTVKDLLLLKKHVSSSASTIAPNTNICARHVRISSVTIYKDNCAEGGCYVSFCADCGTIIEERFVEPRGHIFVDATLTPSTCELEGTKSRKCSVCEHSEEAPIEKLDHVYTWWMLSDDDLDFQYGYCANCNNLGYQEVDRGVLDDVVAGIPSDYELYCTAESRSVLRPIVANAAKALTQEQVDACIEELRRILPTIKYKVTDIPVVYLESRAPISKAYYVSTNIIFAYKDDNGELKSITDSNGEMRIRGNATANVTAKLPFNIKFSRDVKLPGIEGYGKKYHLLANALDTSTIRNAVAFEFAAALGLEYTCQYRFVEVYHDGKYKGCYTLVTPIDIGEDRVDIDDEKDVIIHLSYKNGSEDAAFPSPIFGLKLMRLEEPTEYTPYTKSQMLRIMHQLDFAILSGDTDEMAKFMDMDSMMAYFIFHEYIKDMDMIWDSTRFYIEDGKLHGGPCWDLDISQGNVANHSGKIKTNVGGLDEYSGWHYWNQTEVYGDIVTNEELDKLGEFSSAIGPWADAYWVNDYHLTTNPCNNGQRRWWYSYMIEYSEEFRVDVSEFIRDNESLFRSFYEDVTDSVTGKTTKCIIDELALNGEAAEAIYRNYTNSDAPFGASTHPNSMTYCEDNSLSDAVDYLRTWWKTRCEWLYKYYTKTYL